MVKTLKAIFKGGELLFVMCLFQTMLNYYTIVLPESVQCNATPYNKNQQAYLIFECVWFIQIVAVQCSCRWQLLRVTVSVILSYTGSSFCLSLVHQDPSVFRTDDRLNKQTNYNSLLYANLTTTMEWRCLVNENITDYLKDHRSKYTIGLVLLISDALPIEEQFFL